MKRTKSNLLITEWLTEFKIVGTYIRYNLMAAVELRVAFFLQVVGMMINNIAFLVIWIFFFQTFGTINGWGAVEVIGLQGFVAVTYGIVFSFFSGAAELPTALYNGSFDSLLLTPRNLYLRILTLTTRMSAIGDVLYGIILIILFILLAGLHVMQIGLLILLMIPVVLLIISLLVMTSCLGFFLPDARELGKAAFEVVFGPNLYPAGVFQGAVRIFFIFILPAIVMGGLPIEAVQYFDLGKVTIVWGIALLWIFLSVQLLKVGCRHYESGNLTGARI